MIKLNQILQKELSTYMQKISGATVSQPEVERLKSQIPNLSMGDKEFKTTMEEYNNSMQRAINYFLTTYGFSDLDSASKVFY
jgi:hypothetical protein